VTAAAWRWLLGAMLLAWLPAAASAAGAEACSARVLAVTAAPETRAGERPETGWEPVTLPDTWTQRRPDYGAGRALAAVWYRIDWERACTDDAGQAEPVGLGLDGLTMAGAVYVSDELLWRDASLVEPLSLGWNQPRWWPLPASTLREGVNTVWVRVVSPPELAAGLGVLRLGPASAVEATQAHLQWRQRTAYVLAAGLSGAVGGVFLVVWLLRRREQAFGWYALMSLAWVLYLATLLATRPWAWPFDTSLAMSRLNLAALALYVLSFCLFTFRFGAQALPRVERALYGLMAAAAAAVLLVPRSALTAVSMAVLLVCALVFFANCVQFQWHAWRPRHGRRDWQHMLLALCWLSFLVVGMHDLAVVLQAWSAHETWAVLTSPVATIFMALLLGGRLAGATARIERFNQELEERVAQARSELAEALQREHAQALAHAKLQERVQLAHDLHDGLGGSLVRGMTLVEQARLAQQPLSSERMLSILKLLRDDLRQVIDHGSSTGASVPETPLRWIAPLRYRFTRILDALGIASEWHFAGHWREPPSALQCLGLMRIMEEALSNVIKHSQAQQVRVVCTQPQPGTLAVRVEDDGAGFDVAAARDAGLSVGMRSMAARAERIGGTLAVDSDAGGTVVAVTLALEAAPRPA
jgi:signal transduction histidine kinase